MEKSLQTVVDWAETIVWTQELTTENNDIVAGGVIQVIDVSNSNCRELARDK